MGHLGHRVAIVHPVVCVKQIVYWPYQKSSNGFKSVIGRRSYAMGHG